MRRSCVPGGNNNKAQTGTMDERIDALVLRLHEVPPFLFLSFSFSFERAAFLSARRRPFSPTREFENVNQKTLSFFVFFFFYFFYLFVWQICSSAPRGFRRSKKKEEMEKERRAGERERRFPDGPPMSLLFRVFVRKIIDAKNFFSSEKKHRLKR